MKAPRRDEWFGRDAHDLFQIATHIAGFDARELRDEIIGRRFPLKVNVTMVEKAMGRIAHRNPEYVAQRDRELALAAKARREARKLRAS